jgi:hypothetical protein
MKGIIIFHVGVMKLRHIQNCTQILEEKYLSELRPVADKARQDGWECLIFPAQDTDNHRVEVIYLDPSQKSTATQTTIEEVGRVIDLSGYEIR